MTIDILTVFPEMFESVLNASILGRARAQGLITIEATDIRPFSASKHKNTDDYPFGGGAGMLMMAQPIADCIKAVCAKRNVPCRMNDIVNETAKEECEPKSVSPHALEAQDIDTPQSIQQGIGHDMPESVQQGFQSADRVSDQPEDDHPDLTCDNNGNAHSIEVLSSAVSSSVKSRNNDPSSKPSVKRIYLSPRGVPFTQQLAQDLAREDHLILLCGHYEGVDQRVLDRYIDMEISLGDYVLTGGELGAMIISDCVARLIPGVLGSEESPLDESFSDAGLLEYPQYTRPREFEGMAVPEVLLNGDHAKIAAWRREQAIRVTAQRRPDLLKTAKLTGKEKTAWGLPTEEKAPPADKRKKSRQSQEEHA